MKKVSIVIATYNRAHYIIDTLKSIQEQIYTDWECIIIDDGSTDNTEAAVSNFIKFDKRFTYELRPKEVSKGANACRNYGYRKSSGDLIKFFDSDDIMLPDHLKLLVSEIEKNNLDFAVGDCQNFDENGLRERPYEINRKEAVLSAKNFLRFNVAWITNDLLVKREFADQLKFAEGIKDQASEYQYNIKLLYITTKGKLINQILTHRRIHDDGFVVKAHKNRIWFDQMNAELKLVTLKYLEGTAPVQDLKWLISGHVQLNFKLASQRILPKYVGLATSKIFKYHGLFKGLVYPLALLSGLTLRRGYNLIKFIRT
ncbi:MAG TPA: glycosyltransferase family 2 protein [Leeuwenhoekiella sp.]|nr:family 2 glycosyl transferase [Leeuwenhoekiella sp.]HBO28519.1 glycosyltransferase family 2 protein [Leeuwenhoekiella sp.]HCQ77234.1 glycosyltransferase family 2 protein [Leeuwenhoekiella sp.]